MQLSDDEARADVKRHADRSGIRCEADGVAAAPDAQPHSPLGKTSELPTACVEPACYEEVPAFEVPPELEGENPFDGGRMDVGDVDDEDAFGYGGDLGASAYYS